MKKLLVIIVCIFMLPILLGCQSTPDAPIIVSKGDGKLQKTIFGTPEPVLLAPYSADSTWVEIIDSDSVSRLVVNVNAEVRVPNALSYPVYGVARRDFTDDEVSNFVSVFFGNEDLYSFGEVDTPKAVVIGKMNCALDMLNNPSSPYNKNLAALEQKYAGEGSGYCKKMLESVITDCNNTLATGYSGTKTQADFRNAKAEDSRVYMEKNLLLYNADMSKRLRLNALSGREQTMQYYSMGESGGSLVDNVPRVEGLRGIKISVSEAVLTAEKMLTELHIGDWSLANAGAASPYLEQFRGVTVWCYDDWNEYTKTILHPSKFPQCYYLTYTPTFNDIPFLYNSNFNTSSSSEFSNVWVPSAIRFAVDDNGIRSAEYISPMETTEVLNENVALLDFSEVQAIFRKYIVMKADYSDMADNPHTTINIDTVRLGYIKVSAKNSGESMLIPAWCFYGIQHDKYDSQAATDYVLDENNERLCDTQAGHVFLCINAIDGSIVDLSNGY